MRVLQEDLRDSLGDQLRRGLGLEVADGGVLEAPARRLEQLACDPVDRHPGAEPLA